ncbi:hypothetical protein EHP00_1842 [Ecytonucleospora hepatopenaei]|uniref:Uncharacterized protein n=1 Tax=Ecytonucleospora hepatopenaei TaxID=646526 RepID=A0A1W0E2R1_9MICR|nr:hypothetical protein EHP00_1842 [Ecytonucleospora hepatopenaei]
MHKKECFDVYKTIHDLKEKEKEKLQKRFVWMNSFFDSILNDDKKMKQCLYYKSDGSNSKEINTYLDFHKEMFKTINDKLNTTYTNYKNETINYDIGVFMNTFNKPLSILRKMIIKRFPECSKEFRYKIKDKEIKAEDPPTGQLPFIDPKVQKDEHEKKIKKSTLILIITFSILGGAFLLAFLFFLIKKKNVN